MDLNEFIKKIEEQFDEVVSLNTTTVYRDLDEWSSLTALNILAMIGDEYEVELEPDEMRKTTTIEELFNLVQSKL